MNLNTTHVSVQYAMEQLGQTLEELFKYNPCIGSITLIFMCFISFFLFKYNPCIGSIRVSNPLSPIEWDLNTTHVSVQFAPPWS